MSQCGMISSTLKRSTGRGSRASPSKRVSSCSSSGVMDTAYGYWQDLGCSLDNQDKFADDDFDSGNDFNDFEKGPKQKEPPPSHQKPDHSGPIIQAASLTNRNGKPPSPRKRIANQRQGQKRKAPEANHDSRAAKVMRAQAPEKTSVSILNEAGITSEAYTFGEHSGPSHLPVFNCSVLVDGSSFHGVGSSKKGAKDDAARKAIEFLLSDKISEPELAEPTTSNSEDNCPPVHCVPDVVEENATKADASYQPQVSTLHAPLIELDQTAIVKKVEEIGCVRILENAFRYPPCPTNPTSVQRMAQIFSSFSPLKVDQLRKFLHSVFNMASSEQSINYTYQFIKDFLHLAIDLTEMSAEEMMHVPPSPKKLKQFGSKLLVLNERFEGVCHGKVGAKRKVAEQFLNWILDIVPVAWRIVTIPAELNNQQPIDGQIPDEDTTSRRFAAFLSLKSYEKLDDLYLKYAGSRFARYLNLDHLATVCMFKNGELTPVSLACGSSVIYRKNLDSKGRSLKDCQAEILALRATKLFLLEQMKDFCEDRESIFIRNDGTGSLEVSPEVGIHLFISRVPSGSCSVSSTSPESMTKLRLHSIMGEFVSQNSHTLSPSDPVVNSYYDVREGQQKLHVMSSSDKLMKKAVVGVQGALASCFIQPVFLQTITIKGRIDRVAVASGLYHRILPAVDEKKAPSDCGIVCPEVCRTNDLRETELMTIKQKDSMKAFVWCSDGKKGCLLEEFLHTSTGLTSANLPSRLSKRNLAAVFQSVFVLAKQKGLVSADVENIDTEQSLEYAAIKSASGHYKKRLEFFRDLNKTAELGEWITKCPEEDAFVLDNWPIEVSNVKKGT